MASNAAIFLTFVVAVSASSPPYDCVVPPGNCDIANSIVDMLNSSRTIISEGIPSEGIPPLDPLGPLPPISFHIDADGLLMNFDLNNTMVTNLADFVICQLNVTLGLKQKIDIDLMMDDFHIGGLYDLDGTIAHLLPVFGAGDFTIDAINSGIYGKGKLTYHVITNRASLSDLEIDVFYGKLHVVLDYVLGGGEMADLINSVLDKIAPYMFDAVWGAVKPILTKALEDGINDILKDIPINSHGVLE